MVRRDLNEDDPGDAAPEIPRRGRAAPPVRAPSRFKGGLVSTAVRRSPFYHRAVAVPDCRCHCREWTLQIATIATQAFGVPTGTKVRRGLLRRSYLRLRAEVWCRGAVWLVGPLRRARRRRQRRPPAPRPRLVDARRDTLGPADPMSWLRRGPVGLRRRRTGRARRPNDPLMRMIQRNFSVFERFYVDLRCTCGTV